MTINVGRTDRIRRFVLSALYMAALYLILDGNERYLALLAVIPMTTAITGYCWHYAMLGVDTRSEEEKTASEATLMGGHMSPRGA
jgi:hypothetical protein